VQAGEVEGGISGIEEGFASFGNDKEDEDVTALAKWEEGGSEEERGRDEEAVIVDTDEEEVEVVIKAEGVERETCRLFSCMLSPGFEVALFMKEAILQLDTSSGEVALNISRDIGRMSRAERISCFAMSKMIAPFFSISGAS